MFSAQSYLILNGIIGGQALAAVSDKLNDTLGIVIIGLISFAVGFFEIYLNKYLLTENVSPFAFEQITICGYKHIHWYILSSFPYSKEVTFKLKFFQ